MSYKRVLLGVDLHPACDDVVFRKCISIVKTYAATLYVVHAIEEIDSYGVASAYTNLGGFMDSVLESARSSMLQLCDKYEIDYNSTMIEIGTPKHVILDCAKKVNADLIVVGSHGRSGVGILLGSTANAVLHGANCDVLAVRTV